MRGTGYCGNGFMSPAPAKECRYLAGRSGKDTTPAKVMGRVQVKDDVLKVKCAAPGANRWWIIEHMHEVAAFADRPRERRTQEENCDDDS